MRHLLTAAAAALLLSACLDFDARLEEACALDAGWPECRPDAGASTDAGSDADAGPVIDAGADPDAGTSADGGPASDAGAGADAGRSCFGRSGWCWESPGLFGAPILHAVWGFGDSEVWFGGSGGTVLRLDVAAGTWHWRGDLLTDRPAGTNPEPAVLGAVRDDAGTTWLFGEHMPIVSLAPDGGGLTRTMPTTIAAAATWGGHTYFLPRDLRSDVLRVFDSDGVVRREAWAWAEDIEEPEALLLTASTTCIAGSKPDAGRGLFCSDGGFTLTESRVTQFASAGPQGPHVATGDFPEVLRLEETSGRWVDAGNTGPGPIFTSQLEPSPDGGAWLWFAGDNGFIAREQLGSMALPVTPPYTGALHGSWLSPSGAFWAAGHGARVVKATPVSPGNRLTLSEYGPDGLQALRDGAATDARQVAVADELLGWERSADGRWRQPTGGGLPAAWAVAIAPDGGLAVLTSAGHLVVNGGTSIALPGPPDGGAHFWDGPRAAGLAFAPDGTLWAGLGHAVSSVVLRGTPQVTSHLLPEDFSQVTDLVATDAGAWFTMNKAIGHYEYIADGGAVGAVGFVGPEPAAVVSVVERTAAPLLGVCRWGATVAAVGHGQVFAPHTAMNLAPDSLEWVSCWADAQEGLWILSREGVVMRRDPSTAPWQREHLPWGTLRWDSPSATRITGNGTSVFVFGAHGAVLRRALPP